MRSATVVRRRTGSHAVRRGPRWPGPHRRGGRRSALGAARHHQSGTVNPAPSSRQHRSGTVNPAPSFRHRQSGTVNQAPSIRHHRPGTLITAALPGQHSAVHDGDGHGGRAALRRRLSICTCVHAHSPPFPLACTCDARGDSPGTQAPAEARKGCGCWLHGRAGVACRGAVRAMATAAMVTAAMAYLSSAAAQCLPQPSRRPRASLHIDTLAANMESGLHTSYRVCRLWLVVLPCRRRCRVGAVALTAAYAELPRSRQSRPQPPWSGYACGRSGAPTPAALQAADRWRAPGTTNSRCQRQHVPDGRRGVLRFQPSNAVARFGAGGQMQAAIPAVSGVFHVGTNRGQIATSRGPHSSAATVRSERPHAWAAKTPSHGRAHSTTQRMGGGGRTVTTRRGCEREEELAAVGVLTRVGHRHSPRRVVLQLEPRLLIVELAAVDAVTARAVAVHDVAALAAEAAHDAMEHAALHACTQCVPQQPRAAAVEWCPVAAFCGTAARGTLAWCNTSGANVVGSARSDLLMWGTGGLDRDRGGAWRAGVHAWQVT